MKGCVEILFRKFVSTDNEKLKEIESVKKHKEFLIGLILCMRILGHSHWYAVSVNAYKYSMLYNN